MPRNPPPPPRARVIALTFGALGVVYGDIGTSPLYAFREALVGAPLDANAILGVASLVFWSLVLVIVVKYAGFILATDNDGEGGVLALLGLALDVKRWPGARVVTAIGLVGTVMLMADGMLTPAISVLSAVEGINSAAPGAEHLTVPITLGVLLGLFALQRGGTGRVAAVFGPIVVVWFMAIAGAGLPWILSHPSVLRAVDPRFALAVLMSSPRGIFVLGAIVLCVTGAEALYADLGHFGKRPIRLAWFLIVFPALLISYFGQAAFLLSTDAAAVGNPFYDMLPAGARYPMTGVATLATVAASQALITGMFTLVRQSIRFDFLPRMEVVQTSAEMEGRVFVPIANTMLALGCCVLVVAFGSSSELASAYGVAVTGAMLATSMLFPFASIARLGALRATVLGVLFVGLDLTFMIANGPKLLTGGLVPLVVSAALGVLMATWNWGSRRVRASTSAPDVSLDTLVARLRCDGMYRTSGAAVFLVHQSNDAAATILRFTDHTGTLHETVVILDLRLAPVPRTSPEKRIEMRTLGEGVTECVARYGYLEVVDVRATLERLAHDLNIPGLSEAPIFVGRNTMEIRQPGRRFAWYQGLFVTLSRLARPLRSSYNVPPDRLIELGTIVEV